MGEIRNKKIDVVRGLAMIAVVFGHCGFPLSRYLYLFHMAVFLFVSGYCFNHKNSKNLTELKHFLGRKVWTLYVPYVVFSGSFNLLHNFFIKIGILSDSVNAENPVSHKIWWQILNGFLASLHFEAYGAGELCGGAWFVIVLFEIVVVFAILYWVLNKIIRNQHMVHAIILIVSVLIFLQGNYFRANNIILNDFLSTTCSCFIIYTVGFLCKHYKDRIKVNNKMIISLIGIIISPISLYFLEKKGHISFVTNAYPSPMLMFLCSFFGLYFCFSLAYYFEKVLFVEKILSCVGKHTMFILFLHFLSFKIINALQILVYKKEWYELATTPHLKTNGGWWVLYAIAGITVPILINFIWAKFKESVIKFDKN